MVYPVLVAGIARELSAAVLAEGNSHARLTAFVVVPVCGYNILAVHGSLCRYCLELAPKTVVVVNVGHGTVGMPIAHCADGFRGLCRVACDVGVCYYGVAVCVVGKCGDFAAVVGGYRWFTGYDALCAAVHCCPCVEVYR